MLGLNKFGKFLFSKHLPTTEHFGSIGIKLKKPEGYNKFRNSYIKTSKAFTIIGSGIIGTGFGNIIRSYLRKSDSKKPMIEYSDKTYEIFCQNTRGMICLKIKPLYA